MTRLGRSHQQQSTMKSVLTCTLLMWMTFIAFCCSAAGDGSAKSSGWWPSLTRFLNPQRSQGSDSHTSGNALPHSSYLSSKSLELEGLESTIVAEMRRRSRTSLCWKDAIADLENRCAVNLVQEDHRSRMAMRFTSCQLQHDGKITHDATRSLRCSDEDEVADCVARLDDAWYPIYVQFRLHVDTMCFHAQEEMFQERTEVAVAMLDRVSSSALSRTKELSKRTVEIATGLDDARAGQQQVLEHAKAANEWLLHQHSAQQQYLSAMLKTMAEASHRVDALHDEFANSSVIQKEALVALHGELGSLLEMQRSAGDTAKAIGSTLLEVTRTAEVEADHHRQLVEEMLQRTHHMAAVSSEHQAKMSLSHQSLVETLDRVFTMQQALIRSASSVEAVVFYVLGCILIIILTIPPRTSSGRFPCMMLLLVSLLVEYVLPLTSAFSAVGDDSVDWRAHVLLRWLTVTTDEATRSMWLRRCVVAMGLFVLLDAMWRYESPEARERRVFLSAMQAWWSDAVTTYNSTLQHEKPFPCYADEGEEEEYDTWSCPHAAASVTRPPPPKLVDSVVLAKRKRK